MKLLEVNHLKKVYTTRFGGSKVTALQDVSFDVEQGECSTASMSADRRS